MDSDDIRASLQADIYEMDKAVAYLITVQEKLRLVQGGLVLTFAGSNDHDAVEIISLANANIEFANTLLDQMRSAAAKLITLRDKPR